MLKLPSTIASRLQLPVKSVENTIGLLSQEATIPFIARYRKELTGNLNEVEIEQISDLVKFYRDLEKRKSAVLKAIKDQGEYPQDLLDQIARTTSMTELEDLYLPFKKKRKTKAEVARQAGLEPLARIMLSQREKDVIRCAEKFLGAHVNSSQEAIQGAQHIIAEWVNEDQQIREKLRKLYLRSAVISSKVIKAEASKPAAQKFVNYFEWEEKLRHIPSHRFLAIFRAGKEGVVRVKIEVDKEDALEMITRHHLKISEKSLLAKFLLEAFEDAFMRLLRPSFNNEFLADAKRKADEEAISVFASNLEQLLLSPPLGNKRILALDPGFKSGCKVVCLDENGALLHNETIFPHPPQRETLQASKKIKSLVNAYKIEAISLGNGTASRETEAFIRKIPFDRDVSLFIVNEAGASIYSASKIGREEFPSHDITVRGAVSIGRRLSDPLAELVKIDPKSIGVGQYQHEVDPIRLKEKLDTVVMRCVNRIGVNVNTASKELLSYVSGIGPGLADNILEYRKEKGGIGSRLELLQIPRLGPKVYEQAAGFLRIKDAQNPLDNSAVHPERYSIVERIARDNRLVLDTLVGNTEVLSSLPLEKYTSPTLGLSTLKDIVMELKKPGADPRQAIAKFEFDPSVKQLSDLQIGMKLPGIVNNITNFGCFVDIGIKESGLVHISKLAKGFIKDVHSVVKLNQQVIVTILEVDVTQKRIQCSLID